MDLLKQYLFNDDMVKVKGKDISVSLKAEIIITASTTVACLLYYLLSSQFFSVVSKTYRTMILKDKMFWNLAVVRGTYGVIGCIFSIYERYFDPELLVHDTSSKTLISSILLHNHLGFFLFEWPAQIYFDIRFKTFSKALHGHHIICVTGFLTTLSGDQSHYYGVSAFILEMSTPFSCICYCLMKAGMADSLLWKINQMVLIHVFHLRSVLECCLMYELYKYWDVFSKLSLLWRVDVIVGLSVIGFFLTPYWTYRKTEQMFTKADWNAKKTS